VELHPASREYFHYRSHAFLTSTVHLQLWARRLPDLLRMQKLYYEVLELDKQIEAAEADLDIDVSDADSCDAAPSLG